MTDENSSVYKKNPDTGYDERYITKLLKNFRSHETLLRLPSKMFYLSELKTSADPALTGQFLQWEHLPKKKFPMIFHSVAGKDQREARSPSFFNPDECAVVVEYVKKLFDKTGGGIKVTGKDIGIISPYRRQVGKILDLLNTYVQKKLINAEQKKGITVGSTEVFQGQERKIIIISTVRSSEQFLQSDFKHHLGFLRNSKRFNVAITRSKALLIVVGNPLLLCQDEHWRELISYAHENGGYVGGVRFPSDLLEHERLSRVETAFKKMDLLAIEPPEANAITQIELQEAPEWRADF